MSLIVALVLGGPSVLAKESKISGRVLDAKTSNPIAGATIYHNSKHTVSDPDGRFDLSDVNPSQPVLVKAPGFLQASVPIPTNSMELSVSLKPFQAKGVYLTHFGVAHKGIRSNVLTLIADTELNALVIDVKGDRGFISYNSEVPLAKEAGALKMPTIKDIRGLLADLKNRNIYTIARIVCFKDNVLANYKPQWATINTKTNRPWIDNEHLAWVDPFREEVWQYNVDLAKEAAKSGFDEIQLDYIRFPTDGKLSVTSFSKENTMENRVKALNGFLAKMRKELLPYNVYLSGDIFGYVCWNLNDTSIGQKLEEVVKHLDFISPMVYPSAYHLGIPNYRKPIAYPNEIVYYSLKRAQERIKDLGLPVKIRPWLQNFRDYAFDRRSYTSKEIRAQIEGATKAGSCGWLLWDPRNVYTYTKGALKQKEASAASAVSQD